MSVDNEEFDIGITAGQKMLSAMSGSLLTSLLVTPLDVVRVRLQSQPTSPSPLTQISKLSASSSRSFNTLPPNLGVTACCREVFFATNNAEYCMAAPRIGEVGADCAIEETQKRSYNSTLDGLRKIARNEGVTSLWRGLSPTLVMTIPANIIYFTGYDWLRFNNKSPINKYLSDTYAPLTSGATARIVAAIAVGPVEMFRTRLQANRSTGGSHFAETLQGMGEMIKAHGYTSLWRGFTLTMWRDVPFSGLYWLGYESIRGALTEAREKGRGRSLSVDGSQTRGQARSRSQSRENQYNTFLDSFVAGASSGAVASILTMPFDVGKTRRQVIEPGNSSAGNVLAPEERSMPRFLWHIFKEEGMAGLWRGWIPRTLKIAPSCAIMISCYEVGKRAFRSVNERAERKGAAV
ncbi:probable solute carrier family 25 member 39 [Rhynchosporium secalis]|uniref:Probable solute carrier family 25 member 39 n=1 Tax=Rhynchosporium secalis TaxID=38038 RepID=A0A1E1MTJ6_RHYSE|nr:probable solute carrier family 25 member 39 [Rhynchosporium secalis]